MPGLEGGQVGTKVWLVIGGPTGEGHLTWDISTGMVAHPGGGTGMVAHLGGGLQHNKMWLFHK